MQNLLKLEASNYMEQPVRCTFKASAGGTELEVKDNTDPLFDVPPGTQRVTVTVTPSSWKGSSFWEETFSFLIAPDGSVTVEFDPWAPDAVDFRSRVQLKTQLTSTPTGPLRATIANIKMSQFQDRTKKVLALLQTPPTKRYKIIKKGKDSTTDVWDWVDYDELSYHKYIYGQWPPLSWDLSGVPDAHFLDPMNPLKSRALNFSKGLSPAIAVNSVVLERVGGTKVPKYFAVTWPKAIAPHIRPSPAPFLLFIRQTNYANYYGQGMFEGPGLDPYPQNFDYADACLFESLHYARSPLRNFMQKGVPYQAKKAGADVVCVFPCNKSRLLHEFYDLENPEETEEILKEIQAFFFWKDGVEKPPRSIGNTAIATFSSGNWFLKNCLGDDAKRKGHFLSEVVSGVYFLEPPRTYKLKLNGPSYPFLTPLIDSARAWAAEGHDKRIRLYMQFTWPSLKELMDKPLGNPPYFANSSDNRQTVSVVTNETWSNWLVDTIDPVHWTELKQPRRPSKPVDWLFVHHAIGATMLTHALAQIANGKHDLEFPP
jgi:hypothetical protein